MVIQTRKTARLAVTLLELLVVLLIVSILATLATGVYTGETRRAKVAATAALIHDLELAIARYEIDLGVIPPSGSGSLSALSTGADGSGFLYTALVHSVSGNAYSPANSLWRGPYINLQAKNLDSGATSAGQTDILDAWGNPVVYFASYDYVSDGATQMFSGTAPTGADPDLPAPNPFVSLGETYYNTSTCQIYSLGPDGATLSDPYAGAAADDVSNFGY